MSGILGAVGRRWRAWGCLGGGAVWGGVPGDGGIKGGGNWEMGVEVVVIERAEKLLLHCVFVNVDFHVSNLCQVQISNAALFRDPCYRSYAVAVESYQRQSE